MFYKFRRISWFAKAIVGFALLGVASISSANLVQNGSFEDGNHRNDSFGYMVLNAGDTELDNWVIGNQVAWGLPAFDGFTASDGIGFVDLSSLGSRSPFGEVKQQVNLIGGNKYLFSYDTQGASNVSVEGVGLLALDIGSTVNNWTTFTSMFTATSSALSLLSIQNASGSGIVFIDNISLTDLGGSEVPIPAAIWLFGTALIGLVGFSKRRKAA